MICLNDSENRKNNPDYDCCNPDIQISETGNQEHYSKKGDTQEKIPVFDLSGNIIKKIHTSPFQKRKDPDIPGPFPTQL